MKRELMHIATGAGDGAQDAAGPTQLPGGQRRGPRPRGSAGHGAPDAAVGREPAQGGGGRPARCGDEA